MNYEKAFKVEPGKKVNLSKWDPREKGGIDSKQDAREMLKDNIQRMQELQYKLWAEDRRSVLIVLQGMDAAGKDGTIRHVMSGVNPQGCHVTSFKKPSAEELDHDFLWRIHRSVPSRGQIGIFNRSHYEDVLIVRVHNLVPKPVWSKRYEQINRFEKNLAETGTTILKFYLHIDREEQKERFQARLDNPEKHWKFNIGDVKERQHWDAYREAFEEALERCSKPHAPWYVIPANRKWFRNLAISSIIVDTLEGMDLQIPKVQLDPSSITID